MTTQLALKTEAGELKATLERLARYTELEPLLDREKHRSEVLVAANNMLCNLKGMTAKGFYCEVH